MITVIELEIGDNIEDVAYLPLEENLEKGIWKKGKGYVSCTFEELKENWESTKWGYSETAVVSLVDLYTREELEDLGKQLEIAFDGKEPKTRTVKCIEDYSIKNPNDIVTCEEFDIKLFKDNAVIGQLYSTPWKEEPDEEYYTNYFALDCQRGDIYSKDFAYFQCGECEREICEQNPANGWMTQVRNLDEDGQERVCTKCYEKIILAEGMNKQIIERQSLAGVFGLDAEAKAAGYEVVEGFYNYHIGNEQPVFEKVKELDKEGYLVVVEYERMAIGGLEGYITLHSKKKEDVKESE